MGAVWKSQPVPRIPAIPIEPTIAHGTAVDAFALLGFIAQLTNWEVAVKK
jgi:hypothetical protein